ncbi:MAG: DnaJ domain-containing protein [Anaerolineae bacterium]|nr:DnaJ domain-containing protein [Anaerolineae bacterium]
METSEQKSLDQLLSLVRQDLVDPYEILGLQQGASLEAIKKAYFARVREFPPERDPAAFKQIRAAYEALKTPEAKASADLFLLHPPPPYTPRTNLPDPILDYQPGDWLVLARAYSDLGKLDFRKDYRAIKI